MPQTVLLSRPLKTHKGEITELVLHDLKARDIIEARVPPVKTTAMRDSGEVTMEYRYDVIARLAASAARESGVDEILIEDLPPKDFHKVAEAVVALWNGSGE